MKRLAWCVGGVLALWVVAWLALPPLLKWQGEVRLSEALGRPVTLGSVDLKPWTLELTVSDIAVGQAAQAAPPNAVASVASGASSAASSSADAAASASAVKPAAPDAASPQPLLRIAKLHVDVAASSLFRLAPVIEALEVDAPQLRVSRTAPGHYDIDDLITRFTPHAEAKPSEPARFALYNLQVRDASVRFDDKPVGRVQQVDAFTLALPFISNLPAQVDVKVEPRLTFELNGTAFDSGAQATPFAQTKRGDLELKMADLDVTPYLGYLPDSLPVRLTRGALSAQIALQFSQAEGGAPSVVLKGTAGARDLVVTDAAGAPLVAWKQLQLGLRDVQPLARKLAFDTLRIEGAQLAVSRDSKGELNLLRLATADGEPVAKPKAAASAASAPIVRQVEAAKPWQISLAAIELADARVMWNDASVKPAAAIQLDGIAITAKQVQWPVTAAMPLSFAATLRDQREGAPAAGALSVEGSATDQAAKLDIQLAGLSLDALAPYLAQALVPQLTGHVSAKVQVDWSGAADAPRMKLVVSTASVDALRVNEAVDDIAVDRSKDARKVGSRTEAVSLKQLALADVQLDLLAHSASLGSVKLLDPSVAVTRDVQGQLNLQRWVVGADNAEPASASAKSSATLPTAPSATPKAGPVWRVQLKDFSLEGGRVAFADALAGRPVSAGSGAANAPAQRANTRPLRVELTGLRASLQGLSLQGDKTTAPAKVTFTARVAAPAAAREEARALARQQGQGAVVAKVATAASLGASTSGLVEWKGQFGLQPLLASGNLRIERFPAHLFEPYFRQSLPVSLLSAEAGYKGNFLVQDSAAGLSVNSLGDVLLADVRIDTPRSLDALKAGAKPSTGLAAEDELLSWQSFALKAVKVAIKPGAKPRIDIGEAALSDFFSRLVITEEGKFNLRDVGAGASAAAPEGAASGAVASGGGAAASTPAKPAVVVVAAPAAGASATSTPSEPPKELPVDITVGGTRLINGRIDFTDHFVRPNYSANLTELNGQLGPFRSGASEMATLELRGKAAGTALLEISGALNPTSNPPVLDIRAKATDLELAPLSPYAGKYAGYAIERGKLSMTVAYKIEPDGKLTASNQVVLNQLTFGDKIESPEATKLPVLLAVALLKDRNGVIDINLPVSGSLKDPQFSVGGLIVKVIFNLLAKALTAPFALLSGGGSDDLSLVEFQPGTALLAPTGQNAVDKVATALTERPALRMTVTGASDPVSERADYQRAVLQARLVAERRRELQRAGAVIAAPVNAASAPEAGASGVAVNAPPAPVALSADDRARLLKELYKQTDLPDKPRNALGFAKDIPPAEMESLLAASVPVNTDLMRELALQRGLAVRDALIAKGLTSERLFLAAPKLRAAGEDEAMWTPRVQLTLSTK